MMSNSRYFIMEVETLEARRRYRKYIETLLLDDQLLPEARINAEYELLIAMRMEQLAQRAVERIQKELNDEIEAEEDGRSGNALRAHESGEENDAEGQVGADIETLALLFFLAEHNFEDHKNIEPHPLYEAAAAPLPASPDKIPYERTVGSAALLFDRRTGIVHVQEPQIAGPNASHRRLSEFLPSIEHYAMRKGAHTIMLEVPKTSIELYKIKHGYELHYEPEIENIKPQNIKALNNETPNSETLRLEFLNLERLSIEARNNEAKHVMRKRLCQSSLATLSDCS